MNFPPTMNLKAVDSQPVEFDPPIDADVFNTLESAAPRAVMVTMLKFERPVEMVVVSLAMAREILRFAVEAEDRNKRVLGG